MNDNFKNVYEIFKTASRFILKILLKYLQKQVFKQKFHCKPHWID